MINLPYLTPALRICYFLCLGCSLLIAFHLVCRTPVCPLTNKLEYSGTDTEFQRPS